MKIHIVQKGDTLWEISKKYGVDFEQLKQVNSQISSPDMIMPGMKIKIPSSSKPVQKQAMKPKEMQKPMAKQPYKDTSPKPLPVIKEDDKEKPKPIQPQMPVQQQPQMQPMIQMPIMEQELQNYTTINFPQMPTYHAPAEKPKEKPLVKEKMKPMPLPQPQPMHMVPLCCHVINPHCPPGPNDFFPVMGTVAGGHGPAAPMHHGPMHGPMHGSMHNNNMVQPYMHGNMMESSESSSMEMPVKPMHKAGTKDCGCKGKAPFPPHHNMGYQMNQPPAFGGFNDYNRQGFYPQPNQPGTPYQAQSYPPNFANAPTTNGNPYPTPPGYPSFSNMHEEEDE